MNEQNGGTNRMQRSIFSALLSLSVGWSAGSGAAHGADEINRIIRGLAPISGQTVSGGSGNMLAAPAPGLASPSAPRSILLEVVLSEQVIVVDTSYAIGHLDL